MNRGRVALCSGVPRSLSRKGKNKMKKFLSAREAVEAGYFQSIKTAANRRWRNLPPRWTTPAGCNRALYAVEDLEEWVKGAAGVIAKPETQKADPPDCISIRW